MNTLKNTLRLSLLVLLFSGSALQAQRLGYTKPADPRPQYAGIPSDVLNYYAAAQAKSQWCWAACIQMLLNYHGVSISQTDIVERSYGRYYHNGQLPDLSASYELIHQNLNNWDVDAYGQSYKVQAWLGFGMPEPETLLEELKAGYPVIVGYRTPAGTGHAVLITAASYEGNVIKSLVVRDPSPDKENVRNLGRNEYSALEFAKRIEVYWLVRVGYF